MNLSSHPPRRCVITASTGGAVINECLNNPLFKSLIHSVICDQSCGAADKARARGMPVEIFSESNNEKFCNRLLDYLQTHKIDYVFSFYTKFYSERIRRAYADRLVNLHPTLLPAFKGNDAWEYVQAYGVRFAGSTMEFVHERMDEGKIILQTVCPWDANRPAEFTRHRVFVQQCQSLLQVAKWLADGRIRTDGCRVTVRDARFDSCEFSPALDFPDALRFTCPVPAGCKESPGPVMSVN
ncbi:MAG: formyltransferase family protein [Verrucomicrobiota bacterium]|jgi:phosphoribosylglycinamide formyltransferase-1